MRIDGKAIADQLLDALSINVTQLKTKGVTPTLAVILVGDNPASLSYIKQKQKAAERIGAQLTLIHLPADTSLQTLGKAIQECSNDPKTHGLIVQRPLPYHNRETSTILNSVVPTKDVDGFVPNSPFDVPVALAVLKILKSTQGDQFDMWIRTQRITIIGRGDTAGRPITQLFEKLGLKPTVIHSQTPNPTEIMKTSDIIVSCVGKRRVIAKSSIKPGVILISVGIWRDEKGSLHGDYEEEEIKDIASAYTPTPGGVGPVNVACLMDNLIYACTAQNP